MRQRAAWALGTIGSEAKTVVPSLETALRSDKNDAVRVIAASALGRMGTEAKAAVPSLEIAIRSDKNDTVRGSAAQALGSIGSEAQAAVPSLETALRSDRSADVRGSAAEALGSIGSEAQAAVPSLETALRSDRSADVRQGAALALFRIGSAAKAAVPSLETALHSDKSDDVRRSVAFALGRMGSEAKAAVPSLETAVRSDKDDSVRRSAAEALGAIAFDLQKQKDGLSDGDLQQILRDLQAGMDAMQQDKTEGSLETEVANLQAPLTALQEELDSRWLNQLAKYFSLTWLAHAAFWLALIFAYPKSPQVQAIFFWNPWVRNVFGLGYVPFLLAWVPFLRRKLFEPFRVPLLADAGLDQFNPAGYFADMTVKSPGMDEPLPLVTGIPAIQGQKILEGESGLGKTMFVRHLLRQSQRIVVYLPATRCTEGVIEAIQKKLHSDEIKDPKFLQSLIYSGAMDICIDGLNEVSADTRAKITQFVESHFRGNILITTQSLEWTPPATAKTHALQPLRRDQIEQYLLSRQPVLPKTAPVQGTAYAEACCNFVTQLLDNTQLSAEEQKAAQMVLSNPMELTLVAAMLAGGNVPDLFRLRQQQYTLMAAEYQRLWNQAFPLPTFSEAVYQLRLADKSTLPASEFYNELVCMEDEKYKMVISRQGQDAEGKPHKEWTFRHDKIAEFFIVQTFLGDTYEADRRLEKHMGDPRFRGVYFLLATLLPLDAAQKLREDLIQYAADTKDHSVSDTFVQLLRSR
jgi:tetratricopeptide (TPR) repeat protein